MPNTYRPPCLRPATALAAAVAAALSAVLLSACGGSGSSADHNAGTSEVASIDSPTASGGHTGGKGGKGGAGGGSSADASSKGVQLRLDMTEAEQNAVAQAYAHCLKDQGVPTYNKGPAYTFPKYGADKYPAAYGACQSKKPIPAPELDPATNPHYMDEYRDNITCLNRKGLAVEALPDAGGWTYSAHTGRIAPGSPQEKQVTHDCQVEAFSAGR